MNNILKIFIQTLKEEIEKNHKLLEYIKVSLPKSDTIFQGLFPEIKDLLHNNNLKFHGEKDQSIKLNQLKRYTRDSIHITK